MRRSSFMSLQGSEGEGSAGDEHAVFTQSVREFHCTLLEQFQSTSEVPQNAPVDEQAALNTGKEPYLARFAQPYPARPIWAALPRFRGNLPEAPATPAAASSPASAAGQGRVSREASAACTVAGPGWASDYGCAPLVCVVFRDNPNSREALRGALCSLAAHPVGLLVTVNSATPEPQASGGAGGSGCGGEQGSGLLLFAAVGLQSPRTSTDTTLLPGISSRSSEFFSVEDTMVSKADQREMVWAAVHQALQDEEGALPEVVEEVFMLQDVWLYDRLFRWLAQNGRGCDRALRQITQEELDLLVHEFGEETATHFLFVEHYTRHLRVAALVSLVCMGISFLSRHWAIMDAESVEDWKRAVLTFFLPAWGFHFLASWRSVACKAGFRWHGSLGSVQNSMKESARLQAMESNEAKLGRFLRVALLAVPLMCLQLMVVLAVTTSFVFIEVWIYDVIWDTMSSLGHVLACLVYNLAFGIAFILMLALFHPVSKAVTTWERHPDTDLARWHLTTKIFGNWFLAVFLYFFVIAFCYIPFGDNIADFFAALFPEHGGGLVGDGGLEQEDYIRDALQGFRPDIHRLSGDVLIFFVLQDICRLLHVLFPVVRAAWGLGQLRGAQKGRGHRHKRTAIFFKAFGMCRACCNTWRPRKPQRRVSEDGSNRSVAPEPSHREAVAALLSEASKTLARGDAAGSYKGAVVRHHSTVHLVPPKTPKVPMPPAPAKRGEVVVVYCFMGPMCVKRPDDGLREQVVLAACGLSSPAPLLRTVSKDDGEPEGSPAVTSRLRVCYPVESQQGLLEEDASEDLGDLITLRCDPDLLAGPPPNPEQPDATPTVLLNIFAEVLDQGAGASPLMRGDSISSNWRLYDNNLKGGSTTVELCLSGRGQEGEKAAPARVGTAKLGPVELEYVAGVVRAPTHPEALEKVPRALRRLRLGLPEEAPGTEPGPQVAAFEEACELQDSDSARVPGVLPWVWWDEDLGGLYWDEVFELFAVRETFETFEIYAHLTTQFSYVCLFGIAVPLCPLLALVFTSLEVRQDQLRLLWLSRPPHPDSETNRFKGSVSVGAWYEIIKFTCHMSVAVNLLLWGLTYGGLSSTKPSEWTATEWWRAGAIFSFVQQACFFLSGMLHRTVSQLDHQTAAAYLRRYNRLKQCLLAGEGPTVTPRSCRQVSHETARRQLARAASQGLSSLI